ncbi:MAG: AsnC family protein [Dysgonomonas sp.]
MNRPFYHKLYADMIRDKYPHKKLLCAEFLNKENWTALDVIQVDELLFGSDKKKADVRMDHKHRSYDPESIRQILRHQQRNRLNNSQLACKFGLSRNTIARWKQLFPEIQIEAMQ